MYNVMLCDRGLSSITVLYRADPEKPVHAFQPASHDRYIVLREVDSNDITTPGQPVLQC